MKLVEKTWDVLRLAREPLACSRDDLWVQPEALRDVDACRCSWHADLQFVCRLQGLLVKTDGSIHHAGSIGRIHLQCGVVSGNDAGRAKIKKMFGNRDGERCAFFRISRRAEFVQQHQRTRCSCLRDEINISDVSRKGGKVLLNRLVVANICKDRIENWKAGRLCRNGHSRLSHERKQANRL